MTTKAQGPSSTAPVLKIAFRPEVPPHGRFRGSSRTISHRPVMLHTSPSDAKYFARALLKIATSSRGNQTKMAEVFTLGH